MLVVALVEAVICLVEFLFAHLVFSVVVQKLLGPVVGTLGVLSYLTREYNRKTH